MVRTLSHLPVSNTPDLSGYLALSDSPEHKEAQIPEFVRNQKGQDRTEEIPVEDGEVGGKCHLFFPLS